MNLAREKFGKKKLAEDMAPALKLAKEGHKVSPRTALSLKGQWEKLKLDPARKTVELTVAGMLLDLGGIAKGYAADEGLKVLAKHGITSALVAASGDIAVSGAPPGKPGWRIDIAPLPGAKEKRQLLLKDAAVST